LFGTLISCLKNNNPIIGVIDIPILNYRWYGGKNVGVYFNKKRCSKIKSQKMIKNSIISSTSPFMFNKNDRKKVVNIYNDTRFPIFGTDCYAYGLLLLGKIDLIVEANLKPWDYMAQIPLIKELGGNITDWEGKDLNINSKGKIIASMSMNHHKKLIKFLK
jgi:inositol-phosphate phosphatase/L-galactose 1-phosphate phosphatase/histidinol-phosphatase